MGTPRDDRIFLARPLPHPPPSIPHLSYTFPTYEKAGKTTSSLALFLILYPPTPCLSYTSPTCSFTYNLSLDSFQSRE